MKQLTPLAACLALGALSIALAACGSTDDAATEASPDTVEMAADEALGAVNEGPVADDGAGLDEVEGPPAVSEETAEAAADNAAAVAAEAEAAAAAAEGLEGIDDEPEQPMDQTEETAG